MRALHRAEIAFERVRARSRLHGVTTLGARARVSGSPTIDNRGYVAIGDDFRFSSAPATSHMVVEPRAYLAIGDGVTIGSGACIACTHAITIGDGVRVGRNVMLLDSDFHEAGKMTSAGVSAQIVIDDGAQLDDGVVVLKGARIGREARVTAASVVSGAIGAEVLASGVPARAHVRALGARDVAGLVSDIVEREVGSTGMPDSLGLLRLLTAAEEGLGKHLHDDTLAGATSKEQIVEALVRSAMQS